MKRIFFGPLICLLFFSSCKKDPVQVTEPEPVPVSGTPVLSGQVRIDFQNEVDGAPLVFGKKYVNANGDTFSLKKFTYYISNIQFLKHDTVVAERESYHLIDHGVAASTSFIIDSLEKGNYTSVRLMIGIDSTRNCSGIRSGDLDPAKGMFWTWNSGYIFLKAEGSSPSSPNNGSIVLHVGGFTGVNKGQRQVEVSLPNVLVVKNNTSSVIKVAVNVNELFKSPNTIDFKTQYYVMSAGPAVKPFADNYQDMISIQSVQN